MSYPSGDKNVTSVGGVNVNINESAGSTATLLPGERIRRSDRRVRAAAFRRHSLRLRGSKSAIGAVMREQPDVSLVGDPQTGVAVVTNASFGGGPGGIGGTSVSAPQMAAMWALVLSACKQNASCATQSYSGHAYRLGNAAPASLWHLQNCSGRRSTGGFTVSGGVLRRFVRIELDGASRKSQRYAGSRGVRGTRFYDQTTGHRRTFAGHLIQSRYGHTRSVTSITIGSKIHAALNGPRLFLVHKDHYSPHDSLYAARTWYAAGVVYLRSRRGCVYSLGVLRVALRILQPGEQISPNATSSTFGNDGVCCSHNRRRRVRRRRRRHHAGDPPNSHSETDACRAPDAVGQRRKRRHRYGSHSRRRFARGASAREFAQRQRYPHGIRVHVGEPTGVQFQSDARRPFSLGSGAVFLAGFAIDAGTAAVFAPMQVTETLQAAVPGGDVVRVARYGKNGFTDVDTATVTGTSAANDLNKKYVSVSAGGTASPYVIYAVPSSSAASPAPITISASPAPGQQIAIGGTGTFAVSGQDANGNRLPFMPSFDTDNHAIATASAGTTPLSANVQASAQGGIVNLLSTDPRTGIVGKTAFTVYSQRPDNAGTTFAFAGTLNDSRQFAYPAPTLPPTNATANVTQSVAVSAKANPYGTGTVQDFNVVENDAYPTQSFKTTTDYYYQLASANFTLLGDSAVDDQGNTTSVKYATPQIVDQLPEAANANWSNSPALTLQQTFVGQEQATRTVNSDGSYTDTDNINQGTGDSTVYPAMQILLSDKGDGSSSFTYTFNYTGTAYNPPYTSQTFTWSVTAPYVPSPAPSATPGPAIMDIYESIATVRSTPAPSPVPAYQFSVRQWYALPLYTESDKNLGTVTIPASCNVPAGFGTSAMQIEQQVQALDTALGSIETTTTDSYVVTGFGPVCVRVSDTTKAFYDFNNDTGYNFYYSDIPMQTTTLTEALTLQQSGTSTGPQLRTRMSAGPMQPVSPGAIAVVRSHVQMLAQRNRMQRIRTIGAASFKPRSRKDR